MKMSSKKTETNVESIEDYATWVENKIITEGDIRLMENVLGLVGEAGEVAEKLKKMIRDKKEISLDEMMKELGDCVFYIQAICNFLGVTLGQVIKMNVDKLDDREERGVLSGSGDNR